MRESLSPRNPNRIEARSPGTAAMKVAIIFATDGSHCEDVVLAPFRSASFAAGLRSGDIEPVIITVVPDDAAPAPEPADAARRCRRHELAALLAAERPQAIQTFGPEPGLAAIWPIAVLAGVPIVHCVSCWRTAEAARPPQVSSLAASRARRASRHVAALLGTSRAMIGGLMTAGYFADAMFSVVVPPPVERAAEAMNAPAGRASSDPVFGVYDPCATPDLVDFVSRAIELTGRRNTLAVRIAMATPLPAAPAPIAPVPAGSIEDFLATIDVLAVPAYDDAVAAPLIAALRAGKSVIVPDPSGAAELIEYGRHGLMFYAGSAYHFANAVDIVGQSWNQRPVLLADGGPAIARTHPRAVAQSFAAVYERLASPAPHAVPREPSHG
jgi:hypothetical protein